MTKPNDSGKAPKVWRIAWGGVWMGPGLDYEEQIEVVEMSALLAAQAEIEKLKTLFNAAMNERRHYAELLENEEAKLAIAVTALVDIRKYSLGSTADTCDEALTKIKEMDEK